MVLGIQVAGFLFGLFMLYYSFLNYKRKEFSSKEFSLWVILWIGFMIISLFPYILDPLVKTLNFARTFDLLIIVGFISLAAIAFYTHTIARKSQKRIEKVVREIALNRRKK